jgi:cytochrome c biogenesis protein CcdA/thiol-disulfide isomerase/thioredoxin
LLLLAAFALIAGAVTAISPCVLPVLPALLSAAGAGGRRRPTGVVAGLTATFFVTIVGLASVVNGVGVGDAALRSLAIAVLVAFGLALALPALADRIEAPLSRLARLGPRGRGDGFWSGAGVGAALGLVYAPCAGPILAGVIAVAATQGASADVIVIGAAYATGSGVTLLALAVGGRRLLHHVRRSARAATVQRALGAVMVVTALAMALDLDLRFQETLASELPAFVSNPTRDLERSAAVEDRLRELRGAPRFPAHAASRRAPRLPILGSAPDFAGARRWFNSRPLRLADLRGRVVLIDFWTYTCINCIRTLPFLRALDRRYRDAGLTIVGVHTPEFAFEKDPGNVAAAIRRNRLRYPVLQDNAYATWNAWGNRFWPAKYLVDAGGQVRYAHFGEGSYQETEAAVRALLADAGAKRLGAARPVAVERAAAGVATPETYLGAGRAERFLPAAPRAGTHTYPPSPHDLPLSHFALSGTWRVDDQAAAAVRDARLDGLIRAKEAYLVLGSRGGLPRRVHVLVDGRPLISSLAGRDARDGVVTVREQRLYRLVALPRVQTWRLTLRLDPGVSGYAFTFG